MNELPVRDGKPQDRAYVIDAWSRTAEAEFLADVRKRFHARLAAQLSRARVHIAYDPEDRDTILGFAIVEGKTLRYVYVRGGMRRLGVARKLLSSIDIDSYFGPPTKAFTDRMRPADRGWKEITDASA